MRPAVGPDSSPVGDDIGEASSRKKGENTQKLCSRYVNIMVGLGRLEKPLWAKVLEECRRIRLFVVVAVTAATG